MHDWVLVTMLSLPHVLYAAVWLRPNAWKRLFRRRPVQAFQSAALLGKGALLPSPGCAASPAARSLQLLCLACSAGQVSAFLAWFVAQTRRQGTTFNLWEVPAWSWLPLLRSWLLARR